MIISHMYCEYILIGEPQPQEVGERRQVNLVTKYAHPFWTWWTWLWSKGRDFKVVLGSGVLAVLESGYRLQMSSLTSIV